MRVRTLRDRLLPEVLAALLRSSGGRTLFFREARETAVQFNVNCEQMAGFQLPVPPMPRQYEFAAAADRQSQHHAVHREALRQAEHLFQSLLNQYFGEEN
jgi:type I restriction enzyme S subunit